MTAAADTTTTQLVQVLANLYFNQAPAGMNKNEESQECSSHDTI